MHEAARLRPVVIDESLTDLEALLLAREMGYTGVALKACKGQSQAMLMAAAAQKFGMFLCVQDLTCPGASLIHSAGIAARVPGNAGIEANARQFVPRANKAWEPGFPGLFTIHDGMMNTGQLTGPGLGAVPTACGERNVRRGVIDDVEISSAGVSSCRPLRSRRRSHGAAVHRRGCCRPRPLEDDRVQQTVHALNYRRTRPIWSPKSAGTGSNARCARRRRTSIPSAWKSNCRRWWRRSRSVVAKSR